MIENFFVMKCYVLMFMNQKGVVNWTFQMVFGHINSLSLTLLISYYVFIFNYVIHLIFSNIISEGYMISVIWYYVTFSGPAFELGAHLKLI